MPSEQSASSRTLQSAASFLQRHANEKGVSLSYGYFTKHPVAPLNRKRLTMLLKQIQEQSAKLGRPLRILDLACGGGIITCAAAELGHRALGIDLSQEEIRLAKLFAQEERLNGVFLQKDLLLDTSWETTVEEILGGKPDLVILAYALHHLPRVEEFTDRLSKWLAPGAVLLINEENPDAPLFRLKHRVRTWIQKDTEQEWHRTWSGWKQMLEHHGFDTTAPKGADILPAVGKLVPLKSWSLIFTARKT